MLGSVTLDLDPVDRGRSTIGRLGPNRYCVGLRIMLCGSGYFVEGWVRRGSPARVELAKSGVEPVSSRDEEMEDPDDLNTRLCEFKGPTTCNEKNVKRFLGHSQEGVVLQQVSPLNEQANATGVKLLPNILDTGAKRRKANFDKRFEQATPTTATEDENIKVANNRPFVSLRI
ncbi:hypothetical protein M9H77_35083 [Catharanthus roseus]|uniref:Uncharacterized protein n=1 Tax=Catharanthus roseus TaxID=4058 RepID=A0ACB9ZNQ6_CATRO|nr:hypothetical protein M9H77_35083 [Catharanthus roseus]